MPESTPTPDPAAEALAEATAVPASIPLVVKPVFVGIRAYIGTSYGGYDMTYYRVDLVCRSDDGQWQAERCLLAGEHWLPAVHRCADRAAAEHGVEILDDSDE